MAANESDKAPPWTIRGIPPEERNAATEAARRAGLALGPWLQRAIRTAIQHEREAASRPVAASVAPSAPAPDFEARAVLVAGQFAVLAAAGVPIAKGHAEAIGRELLALLPGYTPPRAGRGKAKAIAAGPAVAAIAGPAAQVTEAG